MEQNLTKQIDIFSILRDVLHEWATILLFAVSVSLLTNGAQKDRGKGFGTGYLHRGDLCKAD